jgi:hypothetical protein
MSRSGICSGWIACLLLAVSSFATPAAAESIAIIGTGQVGSALGRRFAELGHEIVYGSRNPQAREHAVLLAASGSGARITSQTDAAAAASIVVLAVPWDAVEPLVRALGPLRGKLVIDPTNPRRTDSDGYRDYAFDGSNAERIQALVPGAAVVKAFSTLGAETMLDPASAEGPVSIPIAGDDPEAKAVVAALVSGIGFAPVDVGPLRFSRVIEGLHFLRYNAQFAGPRFNYYLRPEHD